MCTDSDALWLAGVQAQCILLPMQQLPFLLLCRKCRPPKYPEALVLVNIVAEAYEEDEHLTRRSPLLSRMTNMFKFMLPMPMPWLKRKSWRRAHRPSLTVIKSVAFLRVGGSELRYSWLLSAAWTVVIALLSCRARRATELASWFVHCWIQYSCLTPDLLVVQ
jgi:hypothetical protein